MAVRTTNILSLLVGARSACLCIYDIDRTLTGLQDLTGSQCPANVVQHGVIDDAYGGGTLTLSAMAQSIKSTFCGGCYLGVISAGSAGGPDSSERGVLLNQLRAGSSLSSPLLAEWSVGGCNPTSPLVTSCGDGQKQTAVLGIISWYAARGVSIQTADVHFFDDRSSNIEPFRGTGYNARQISCATRDAGQGGAVGLCGATTAEIVSDVGVVLCGPSPAPSPSSCTGNGKDPYVTGQHVACCAGLDEKLADWDHTGRYYYKCMAARAVNTTVV